MKAVCRICGKDFEKRGRAVTCSVECSDINRKRHFIRYEMNNKSNRGVYIECKICGKQFRKYGSTLTCSEECKKINNKKMMYLSSRRHAKRKQLNKKGVCKICGKEFFKNGINTKCCSDECRLINKKRSKQAHSQRKELKRKLKRISLKKCLVCGKDFEGHGNKYFCSENCAILHRKMKKSERKITKRFAGREIDLTITLDELIKRDNNICYICGKPCDGSDFVVKNGYTICGNQYPSIDHVIPASKGGTHTWNNVRLAHRLCNSYKCDSLYKETENGQIGMFV